MSCDSINQPVETSNVAEVENLTDMIEIVRKLPCLTELSYLFEIFEFVFILEVRI